MQPITRTRLSIIISLGQKKAHFGQTKGNEGEWCLEHDIVTRVCVDDGCGWCDVMIRDALTLPNYECYTPEARRGPTSLSDPSVAMATDYSGPAPFFLFFFSLSLFSASTLFHPTCITFSSVIQIVGRVVL